LDTLFHYTTAAGLLGILQDANIWATDLRFLNDAQESIYARDIVVGAVEGMENPVRNPSHFAHENGENAIEEYARYQELVLRGLKGSEFGVYVACFCESGDLLSQWRGYGRDHGYAIEITKEALRDSVGGMPTYSPATGLFKVQYGLDAANEISGKAIEEMAGYNLNHPGVKAHFSAMAISSMLAQVKHPGFTEEEEWRLVVGLEVVGAPTSGPGATLFRATPMAIVPYLKIPLRCESIVSIRVGPGENAEVRASGIRRILTTLGSSATVTHSEVPLRS
jgi:hypothetical protein